MVDIGEHQAAARLVDDDADVPADPHRPEVRIRGLVDAVDLQTGAVRLPHQRERRQLRLLLLVIGKLGEGGDEAVGEDGGHDLGALCGCWIELESAKPLADQLLPRRDEPRQHHNGVQSLILRNAVSGHEPGIPGSNPRPELLPILL